MADKDTTLKACPACNHKLSVLARACPQCGYPLAAQKSGDLPRFVKWVLIGVLALCFASVLGFLMYMGRKPSEFDFEYQRMYFAYGVLLTMAVLLVVAATLYITVHSDGDRASAGKEIFDSFIKILPPIATLILGYYFGTTQAPGSRVTDFKSHPTQQSTAGESKEAPPSAAKK